ncbi:MAG: hypothetical protein ABIR63_00515 [Sphingomicrobium sp.]
MAAFRARLWMLGIRMKRRIAGSEVAPAGSKPATATQVLLSVPSSANAKLACAKG